MGGTASLSTVTTVIVDVEDPSCFILSAPTRSNVVLRLGLTVLSTLLS